MFYDLVTKKKILLILGPARSNVAEPTATIAKFLNVIQVFLLKTKKIKLFFEH